VVTERSTAEGSLVNVGLRSEVVIDRFLKAGVRTTVQMEPSVRGGGSSSSRGGPPQYGRGTPVSPNTPRETYGIYWGYQTRVAKSLGEVFSTCPYFDSDGGYDLFVGHSEKNGSSVLVEGDADPSDPSFTPFSLPPFRHMLLVFGGSGGIETAVDADERLDIAGRDADTLFDLYLRLQPEQGPMCGSRTLRSEEALSIGLTKLGPYIDRNTSPPGKVG
jgi:predicted SPOUT superfamily RNA methylase MTH1